MPSLLQHCKQQCCHRYDLGSFDVRLIFVGLSSDDSFKSIRRTSVHPKTSIWRSLDFRPMPYRHTSCALPSYVLRLAILHYVPCHHTSYTMLSCVLHPVVLRPTPYRPALCRLMYYFVVLPFHPTSVWFSSNLRPTFVGRSFDLRVMSVCHASFPTTHYILQTIRCVRIL